MTAFQDIVYVYLDLPWLGSLWPVRLDARGTAVISRDPVSRNSHLTAGQAWVEHTVNGMNASTRLFSWDPDILPDWRDASFSKRLYETASPVEEKRSWFLSEAQAESIAKNPPLPSKQFSHAVVHMGPPTKDIIRMATLYARATNDVGYRTIESWVGMRPSAVKGDESIPRMETLWPEMVLFRKRRTSADDFVYHLRCPIEIRTTAAQSTRERMKCENDYLALVETHRSPVAFQPTSGR